MCDTVQGSIIVSVHREDPGRERMLGLLRERFPVLDMAEYLDAVHALAAHRTLERLPYDLVRLTVPAGSEAAIAREILLTHAESVLAEGAAGWRFLAGPEFAPFVEPEHVPQGTGLVAETGADEGFSFSGAHAYQLSLIGVESGVATSWGTDTVAVGLIDSGWADTGQPLEIGTQVDFTEGLDKGAAPDTYGHGSVVASMVANVAPNATFQIYKVCRGPTDAREFGFLAALLEATADCRVVNASLGFGLHDRACGRCGRDYHSTRSLVFERTMWALTEQRPDLVFVGAAGNAGKDRPTYPARYPQAICVGSTNDGGFRSTFSNYGTYDHEDRPHPCLVFAPGGDRQDGGTGGDEYVASFLGRDWRGTSFSAPYVTGVVAEYLGRSPTADRKSIVEALNATADRALIQDYDPSCHGAGMVQRIT